MRSKNAYHTQYRVYYEDTDAGGVMYHANYVNFLERCRSDWLASLGCSVAQLTKNDNILFVVREIQLQYHRPARLLDDLTIYCEVLQMGKVSLLLKQHVYNQSDCLAQAIVKLGCLTANTLRITPMPQSVVRAISQNV